MSATPTAAREATDRAVEAVWKIESPRIVAALFRMVRDLGAAEELAQDALVVALEEWPRTGVPDNPAAWLTTTAKRRAIDRLRRGKMIVEKHDEIFHGQESPHAAEIAELERQLDDPVGDDLLRLIFVACHPALPREGRLALTLRLLGGLSTGEIARAFLVGEATVAQRIVRAKRTIAQANVPFETPRGEELAQRLGSVLEVIYLIFNEGYSATAGDDWIRPQLCDEAMRLARVLAGLAPQQPEVHALAALLELQGSRLPARIGAAGEPVLLLDQDRSRWDRLLIRRGLAALARAEKLGGSLGPYALQAAIAACHARAATASATDWPRIAALYALLARVAPSPVVELNRGVAVAMASGPAAGLAVVDALRDEPSLADYPLLPSVRADLLVRLERFAEARGELERAMAVARNEAERRLLSDRLETISRKGNG